MLFSSVVPKIEHISHAEALKLWVKKKTMLSVVHIVIHLEGDLSFLQQYPVLNTKSNT